MAGNNLTPNDAAWLLNVLEESMTQPEPNRRAAATAEVTKLCASVDQQLGLAPLLLYIAASTEYSDVSRQSAAIQFKNVVKKSWHPQRSEHCIQESDKEQVRQVLFGAMVSSPAAVRRVLIAAISEVCETDFPYQYPRVLDDIAGVLNNALQSETALQDMNYCEALEGTLTAAHGVFSKYRSMPELTQALADEIVTINKATGFALVAILEQAARTADITIRNNSLPAARILVQIFTLATEVLHDLTTGDLGDEHDAGLQRIVNALVSAMQLECPMLMYGKAGNGPLLELRSAALGLIAMYMERYDEDMQPYAQALLQTVWGLISTTEASAAAEDLIVTAFGFFESACRGPHRGLLEPVLPQLCEQLIVPALQLDEQDVENFEDEPMVYIQREIEGSDVHTRRHSAIKLVRALLSTFTQQCAQILNGCVMDLVQRGTWQARDSAIVLVTAMGLKVTSSMAMGGYAGAAATELTDYVDLATFYSAHIQPEISTPAEQSGSDTERFLVKADALRFVATFRHHLPVEALAQLIPHVGQFLSADNVVLHTYAAHAIERILSLPPVDSRTGQYRLTEELVAPYAPQLLEVLCGSRIGSDTRANEYTAKCLMQVLRSAPSACRAYTGDVMAVLANVLTVWAKNPSNPLYSHYLFEAIGHTLSLASNDAQQCLAIEGALWSPLIFILAEDVIELMPYALQILALLLDQHPAGAPSTSPSAPLSATPTAPPAIPQNFLDLYGPLTSTELFQHPGNIPAAVRLITSFVRKDPVQLNELGFTPQTLQLTADKLLLSRLNDHHGFEIIGAMIIHYPREILATYLPTVFRVLFDRLQSSSTPKFARLLALFCASLLARHGATYFEDIMEGIQRGMTAMVLERIVLPVVAKVTGYLERKTCAVGLSMAVQDSQALLSYGNGQLWATCVLQCLSLLHLDAELDEETAASSAMVHVDHTGKVEDLRNAVGDDAGTGSKYVPLQSAARPPEDPCDNVADPRALFKEAVKNVVEQRPDAQQLLQRMLPPPAFATLAAYF
jgi:exportin-2 (importin alpha re-exporter)